MFSFTSKRTSGKRRLGLLAAVMAIGASCLVGASPASAASDGSWCSNAGGNLWINGNNAMNISANFTCYGTVAPTVILKRNGAVLYSASYPASSNVWSERPLQPGLARLVLVRDGEGLRQSGVRPRRRYQLVITYTTQHAYFYAPYSKVLTTGAPRAYC